MSDLLARIRATAGDPGPLTYAGAKAVEATGAVTERGFGRKVRVSRCRCGSVVLRGLDAEVAALDVTCDPAPVGVEGEIVAVRQGRRTYDVVRERTRFVLEIRRAAHVSARPRYPVVVEHTC